MTPAHHYSDFRFKTYAPVAFRYFRELFGIRPDDYLVSFQTSRPGTPVSERFSQKKTLSLRGLAWVSSRTEGHSWLVSGPGASELLALFSLPQYSLCNEPLIELCSSGASGSLFYVSSDDEFIIKTVQHKEAEFLQKLLPGYYMVRGQGALVTW